MPKAFEGQEPFQYQKISKEEQEKRGILGRLVGRIADPNKPTRNGRLYSRELWEKVLNDPIFNEKLENKQVWGELEHPQDGRTSIDYKNAAVCLAEKPKFGKDGFLYGVFDIVKTDCGKLLKTLLDYGSTFAISSRGDGDLFTNNRGQEEVDPDTYQCFTFDIVGVPGVKEARLTPVLESFNGTNKKSLNESLFELYNNSDNKEVIMETLNNLGISLNENQDKIDYVALTKEAKELLGTNYGKITNTTGLEKALKKAIDENKQLDYQKISKLLCIYDKDFVKKYPVVKELSDGKKIQMADTMNISDVNSIEMLPNNNIGETPSAEMSQNQSMDTPQATDMDMPDQELLPNDQGNAPVENTSMPEQTDDTTKESLNQVLLRESSEELYNNIDGQQQQSISADIIDKEGELSNDVGNSMSAIIDSLQEALKTKQDKEAEILKLNEKLSVCYAKEAKQESLIIKLQENLSQAELVNKELSKFKSRTEKQSALIENANQTIRNLNAKCNEIVGKYNSLAEKYNSNMSQISSLNENLSTNNNKIKTLIESNKSLREELANANNELDENKQSYASKLAESNTLVEKYKNVALRAINKYIDSQAKKLDITSVEIKNKLPENYTFNDIDSICESLQKQKVSMNLLPFKAPNKLYESMNVEITGKTKREPILENKPSVDDEVDDSLMNLAKM